MDEDTTVQVAVDPQNRFGRVGNDPLKQSSYSYAEVSIFSFLSNDDGTRQWLDSFFTFFDTFDPAVWAYPVCAYLLDYFGISLSDPSPPDKCEYALSALKYFRLFPDCAWVPPPSALQAILQLNPANFPFLCHLPPFPPRPLLGLTEVGDEVELKESISNLMKTILTQEEISSLAEAKDGLISRLYLASTSDYQAIVDWARGVHSSEDPPLSLLTEKTQLFERALWTLVNWEPSNKKPLSRFPSPGMLREQLYKRFPTVVDSSRSMEALTGSDLHPSWFQGLDHANNDGVAHVMHVSKGAPPSQPLPTVVPAMPTQFSPPQAPASLSTHLTLIKESVSEMSSVVGAQSQLLSNLLPMVTQMLRSMLAARKEDTELQAMGNVMLLLLPQMTDLFTRQQKDQERITELVRSQMTLLEQVQVPGSVGGRPPTVVPHTNSELPTSVAHPRPQHVGTYAVNFPSLPSASAGPSSGPVRSFPWQTNAYRVKNQAGVSAPVKKASPNATRRDKRQSLLQSARASVRVDARSLILIPDCPEQRCTQVKDRVVHNLMSVALQQRCPNLPPRPLEQLRRDGKGHIFLQFTPEAWPLLDSRLDSFPDSERRFNLEDWGMWTLQRIQTSATANCFSYVLFGVSLDYPLEEFSSNLLQSNAQLQSDLPSDVQHVRLPRRLNRRVAGSSTWAPSTAVQFWASEDLHKLIQKVSWLKLDLSVHVLQPFETQMSKCMNCNQFGHNTKFCRNPALCRKCQGTHPTRVCPLQPSVPVPVTGSIRKASSSSPEEPAVKLGKTVPVSTALGLQTTSLPTSQVLQAPARPSRRAPDPAQQTSVQVPTANSFAVLDTSMDTDPDQFSPLDEDVDILSFLEDSAEGSALFSIPTCQVVQDHPPADERVAAAVNRMYFMQRSTVPSDISLTTSIAQTAMNLSLSKAQHSSLSAAVRKYLKQVAKQTGHRTSNTQ